MNGTPEKSLLTLILLGVALALFVAAFHLTRNRAIPPFLETLLKGKVQYLCAGVLVGVGFSSRVEGGALLQHAQVSLIGLLLAWMGLELGIRAEFRSLRKAPVTLTLFDATQGMATFLLILSITIFFLPAFSRRLLEGADPLGLTSVLSVAASVTAIRPDPFPLSQKEGAPGGAAGNVVSICLLGCVTTLLLPHPPLPLAGRLFVGPWDALLLTASIGVGTGILLDLTYRVERSILRASTLAGSLMAVSGALCVASGLPALFAGLIAGAWLINATLRRRDIRRTLEQSGSVVEGIFMFTAGSMIGLRSADSPLSFQGMAYLAMILFLSRAIAKTIGVGLLWRLFRPSRTDQSFRGMWQLPQGSLAIAVCVQPIFVATQGPLQAVTLVGGTALAVALSQFTAFSLSPPARPPGAEEA